MLSPYIITSAFKLNIKYNCKLVARRTNLPKIKINTIKLKKKVEHKLKKKEQQSYAN